ncbi:MAG: L-alanine-DL-glutamate epimerase [Lentisphaeria bacterium]|nr:L-alanine-DL-glutamate epimerase [Lentisphaeria bacterium]
MRVTIDRVGADFEREPLVRPFGFKGAYVTEIWQTVAGMQSSGGHRAACLNTQSVLWSDAELFARHTEAAGNGLMFAMTEFALQQARGRSFETPFDLLDELLPETYEYGRQLTRKQDLRLTFALNALVGVDAAAWVLYARENGLASFDEMVPSRYRTALDHRHRRVACIPLMAYAIPMPEIAQHVEEGFFFLKVKIGSDPDRDGDREKMLRWDMARVQAIHEAIGRRETPYTSNGRIPYYFDANGRYDSKDRLCRFLDHCRRIGAFEQIAIIEEPFPEEYRESVADLGVRIAADESAHSDRDVEERIGLGYGAIALKPIAKTLSMTLRMADVAHRAGVPLFCADLTVGPIQVDWNKNVACRLPPLPGMAVGVVETNGHQNYARWPVLQGFHPCSGAAWMTPREGCFVLDDDFYARSGGILQDSPHYLDLAFGTH